MQPLSFVDLGRNAHVICNENEFKRSVGFVIFSSRGKKDLRHTIHAAYLISLISSVRATAKGRFDTRI